MLKISKITWRNRLNIPKISKYSRENLFQYVKLLDQKVYFLFYDLLLKNFDDATYKLSNCLDIIETNVVKVNKDSCLTLLGYLKLQELQSLVAELDMMDISEIYISEYRENVNATSLVSVHNDTSKNICKQIYINKDEKIIQLYNFI